MRATITRTIPMALKGPMKAMAAYRVSRSNKILAGARKESSTPGARLLDLAKPG